LTRLLAAVGEAQEEGVSVSVSLTCWLAFLAVVGETPRESVNASVSLTC